MKNCILRLFLLLIITACNTKNNDDAKKEGTIVSADKNYYSEAIGTAENGKYNITDSGKIKKAWEATLKKRLKLNDAIVELDNIEIIKVKTTGEAVEDCYIIVSKTKDGSIAMSAILEYKNDKFYFETEHLGGGEGYLVVVCKGEVKEGYYPGVRLLKHGKYLVCSACAECEKIDLEMYD